MASFSFSQVLRCRAVFRLTAASYISSSMMGSYSSVPIYLALSMILAIRALSHVVVLCVYGIWRPVSSSAIALREAPSRYALKISRMISASSVEMTVLPFRIVYPYGMYRIFFMSASYMRSLNRSPPRSSTDISSSLLIWMDFTISRKSFSSNASRGSSSSKMSIFCFLASSSMMAAFELNFSCLTSLSFASSALISLACA